MGVMIWDSPLRSSGGLSIAEYEAEERAYRLECARIEEAEDEDARGPVGGSVK
jgi:hypothetical protein